MPPCQGTSCLAGQGSEAGGHQGILEVQELQPDPAWYRVSGFWVRGGFGIISVIDCVTFQISRGCKTGM